ncbi:hypothetical protein [Liquorilactobacillus oeni]|uniref:Uncharacterized protein n=1 Tax=Liquorilactobacillus oeni DSM 19972 TaxID=1423777 RepID=A0A0R1MHB4_9LACO|nr:hypothetical protein [Liquorilactobacillus oeni]KRL04709.1 hypothetical protein FD46_GL001845 [Liquorilactobacillus oeni DSM 19972]
MALRKTTLQQTIQAIQEKFNSTFLDENISYQQMPAFQLNFFITQAIQKHKLIKLCFTDHNENKFSATGFINQNKSNKDAYIITDIYGGITHLIMFTQIKNVKAARIPK